MRRAFHLLALAALAAFPARGETLSAEIGRAGLAATEARLSALSAPSDSDRFALGGLRFLRAIEGTLQARWEMGLPDQMRMIPFLRLPVPENPSAPPFAPGAVAQIFRNAAAGMEAARAPLLQIPDTAEVSVEISLADLWFDIDTNGRRDPGEDLLDVAGPMILGWRWMNRDPATPAPVIRFDTADAAWLAAYTHLLQGLTGVILAYDPTVALERMMSARATMGSFSSEPAQNGFDRDIGEFVDAAFVVIEALDQPPDAAAMASARENLLAMVAQNRRFWALVARETDNDREWLPNDAQQSALGIAVPPGTGAQWMAVLADLEAILTGELLVPYWRVAGAGGVDVGAMFTRPAAIDLAGWIQGADAVPYLRAGPVADGASWRAFEEMMAGEAMLMSLFLN